MHFLLTHHKNKGILKRSCIMASLAMIKIFIEYSTFGKMTYLNYSLYMYVYVLCQTFLATDRYLK